MVTFPNEHAVVSDDAFYLKDLPKNVLVVGGGYIAVEFAGIFNGYGADTTLVYRGEKILRGFDIDVRLHLAAEMEKKGVKFIWDSVIDRIDKKGKAIWRSILATVQWRIMTRFCVRLDGSQIPRISGWNRSASR